MSPIITMYDVVMSDDDSLQLSKQPSYLVVILIGLLIYYSTPVASHLYAWRDW